MSLSVSRWASELRVETAGLAQTGDNDLWIAATAISRGLPLVSCDGDFMRIAVDHPLEHIYLPPRA